jgi:hypothetical protein
MIHYDASSSDYMSWSGRMIIETEITRKDADLT